MLRCLRLFSLAYTLFNVLVITYAPSTTQPFAFSLTYSKLHTLSLIKTYHHFNVSLSLDIHLHGVRMASALRRPTELSFEENCAENWRAFELDFDIYVEAARPGANAKTKAYMLLNVAGREAIERSRTFEYTEGESMEDPDVFKRKFGELCEPKKKLTMLRHRFNTRNQKPTKLFQSYFVDLTNKADSCKFGDKKGEFIQNRILCGIHSDTVRKLLLREPDFTLEKS